MSDPALAAAVADAIDRVVAQITPTLNAIKAHPAALYAGTVCALERHAIDRGATDVLQGVIQAAVAPAATTVTVAIDADADDGENEVLAKSVEAFQALFGAIEKRSGDAMALNALLNCYLRQVRASGRADEVARALAKAAMALKAISADNPGADLRTAPVGGRA